MAPERRSSGGIGGISLGGILVIAGIVLMVVWSFWIGLIIALVGLIEKEQAPPQPEGTSVAAT